jgi:exosortase
VAFPSLAVGASVALLWGWLYFDTGTALVGQWLTSADASYGLALAVVAVALAWRRRAMFASAIDPAAPPALGITILGFGVAIYLTGSLGSDIFLTRVSSVLVIAGVMCFLSGPAATRVMAAPLIFLLLAIPPPTLVVTALTLPLQTLASRIGETTLMAAGVPVVRDGNLLRLPSTTLEIAEACSGLRSLLSLGALAVVLSWATERSWPRRAIIVAAAVPIAVVVNGLRVAVTGFACELWGPTAATDPWHTLTGWLTFAAAMGLLVSTGRLIGGTRAPASDDLCAAVIRP